MHLPAIDPAGMKASSLPKPSMAITSYKQRRCLTLINQAPSVDINHSPGQGQSLFQPTGLDGPHPSSIPIPMDPGENPTSGGFMVSSIGSIL